MAVIPTGAIYKALIFDGESSRNYGVYITGEAVYNSPERDVEMIKIPGRNGEFALDNGRFENIEVTYPAGIFANNESDFAAAISDFRNFLASRVGYCRLEDEYNPNEYRMAVYKSGLNVDPAKLEAGEFSITFDCKPQRWLKDGETAVTIGEWGETETASGDIVSVENPNGILAVKSLEVDLEPIQDLHGYDKPWAGGAGKNKLPDTRASGNTTISGVTFTTNSDGSVMMNGTATGTIYYNLILRTAPFNLASGGYIVSGLTGSSAYIVVGDAATNAAIGNTNNMQAFTLSEDLNVFAFIRIANGATFNNVKAYPMIRASGTDSTYEPYSNICPISGHTSVDVIVSPTTTASDGTTYTTALGRTVYGGDVEQVSGKLTDEMTGTEYDGDEAWSWANNRAAIALQNAPTGSYSRGFVSNYLTPSEATTSTPSPWKAIINSSGVLLIGTEGINSLEEWKTYLSANPLQVVYKLATPQTYQLTAQQIELLIGTNNLWSDSGDITLEYGQNPSVLFNPTLFESSPFLEAEGEGIINFNGYEIDLDGVPYGEIVIGESSYGFHSSTVTVTLDTTLLNTGDAIYPQIKDCMILARLRKSTSPHPHLNSISSTTNMLEVQAYGSAGRYDDFHIRMYPDFGDGFVYGTSKTITSTAVIIYRIGANPDATPTYTETVQITIAYGGADTYTVDVLGTGTLPPDTTRLSWALSVPIMYGNSTKAVSGVPIYIDCDLGEAYIIIDGAYVSLNHRIDLGSELPTLGVGANEVTFDNTITELKITPRWWKV